MCNENNSGCAGGMCGEKGNCGGGSCACGMKKCGGCLGGHKVIRFAVGLFLLWLVFAFGMQIGEMKSELGKGYGSRGMMQYYGNDVKGYGMMGAWGEKASQQAPVPATTTPAVKK